jgi:hypothetical protein
VRGCLTGGRQPPQPPQRLCVDGHGPPPTLSLYGLSSPVPLQPDNTRRSLRSGGGRLPLGLSSSRPSFCPGSGCLAVRVFVCPGGGCLARRLGRCRRRVPGRCRRLPGRHDLGGRSRRGHSLGGRLRLCGGGSLGDPLRLRWGLGLSLGPGGGGGLRVWFGGVGCGPGASLPPRGRRLRVLPGGSRIRVVVRSAYRRGVVCQAGLARGWPRGRAEGGKLRMAGCLRAGGRGRRGQLRHRPTGGPGATRGQGGAPAGRRRLGHRRVSGSGRSGLHGGLNGPRRTGRTCGRRTAHTSDRRTARTSRRRTARRA